MKPPRWLFFIDYILFWSNVAIKMIFHYIFIIPLEIMNSGGDFMQRKIVAVRKQADGSIGNVKLNDGNVLSMDRAIQATKEGFIGNVRIELDANGREYLLPNAFINVPDTLDDFPPF